MKTGIYVCFCNLQLIRGIMKFLMKVIAAFAVTATVAYAACPPNMPYGCRPGPNGKQICGCGQGGW